MEPAITISALSVVREQMQILRGVSATLPVGKIIGLLGPSGSGKTTLLRSLIGRQAINGGTVTILGSPAGASELRSQIGYMPQIFASYLDLTVQQNLDYFAQMAGQSTDTVPSILKQVDLADKANHLVKTLSGGEKSRVSLAIALLGKPQLLILDEPTVGVDPVLQLKLWHLFRKLADGGTTILVSSHVMEEAEHCDELLLLRAGQAIAYGTPRTLKEQTATKSVEAAFLHLIREEK